MCAQTSLPRVPGRLRRSRAPPARARGCDFDTAGTEARPEECQKIETSKGTETEMEKEVTIKKEIEIEKGIRIEEADIGAETGTGAETGIETLTDIVNGMGVVEGKGAVGAGRDTGNRVTRANPVIREVLEIANQGLRQIV